MKIERTVTTLIDRDLCTGCGQCVIVCPSDTITMSNRKAVVSGVESLNCGHCAAVCPTGAITVAAIDPSMSTFRTFQQTTAWSPHGRHDTAALVNLMRSRRSCRNFTDSPVARDILQDLVRIGVTAPSGSNCQMWTFTVLADKASVNLLARRIGALFQKLNAMAEKAWLRTVLRIAGKPELNDYYHSYYESIKKGLVEWETDGRDRLFHGAVAAIVVASKNQASCPAEDALLATQNILLGAHTMGLGTCLIGFAIAAMRQDRAIQQAFGIPLDEMPYAVIALGYPKETYQQVAGRKRATIRFVESSGRSSPE